MFTASQAYRITEFFVSVEIPSGAGPQVTYPTSVKPVRHEEDAMDLEARIAALEGRVRYLEDQEKIRECLAEYGFNADLGRSDNYVAGWTPDGVYDLDRMYLDGEADLRNMIASPDGFHKTQVENRSQHTVLNLYIRIEGDSAWAEGYSVVFVRQDDNIKAI